MESKLTILVLLIAIAGYASCQVSGDPEPPTILCWACPDIVIEACCPVGDTVMELVSEYFFTFILGLNGLNDKQKCFGLIEIYR